MILDATLGLIGFLNREPEFDKSTLFRSNVACSNGTLGDAKATSECSFVVHGQYLPKATYAGSSQSRSTSAVWRHSLVLKLVSSVDCVQSEASLSMTFLSTLVSPINGWRVEAARRGSRHNEPRVNQEFIDKEPSQGSVPLLSCSGSSSNCELEDDWG
jgi:hypothetical protein